MLLSYRNLFASRNTCETRQGFPRNSECLTDAYASLCVFWAATQNLNPVLGWPLNSPNDSEL